MPSESRTVSITVLTLLRSCCRSGRWVLQIVVADECFSNVDAVGGEQNSLDLTAINHQVDPARFRVCIQCSANIVLQRGEYFLSPPLIVRLRVFALALIVLFHLIELIDLPLDRFRIYGRGRRLQL